MHVGLTFLAQHGPRKLRPWFQGVLTSRLLHSLDWGSAQRCSLHVVRETTWRARSALTDRPTTDVRRPRYEKRRIGVLHLYPLWENRARQHTRRCSLPGSFA